LVVIPIESSLFAALDMIAMVSDTDKIAKPAACVTVMVIDVPPDAVIVTKALRVLIVGFVVAVIQSVPLPVAVSGLRVNHVWSDDANHEVFE
jgi:hypothetical protein